jgi:hypothetical protein
MSVSPLPPNSSTQKPVEPKSLRQFGLKLLRAMIAVAILIVLLLLGSGVWELYNSLKTADGLTATAYDEWASAKADHAVVVAVAEQCAQERAKFAHPLQIPASFLTIIPNGRHGKALPNDTLSDVVPSTLQVDAPSYILGAIALSNDIGRARVDMAGDEALDSAWMQIFEWALILTGAISTVLISVKSMSGSGDRSAAFTALGIGAIIFSTLCTSVAAVNSFYSPRSIYERDARTLTSLRNLHLQLAGGITRENNLCVSWTDWSKDWRFARIKAFSDQYAAITNTSGTVDRSMENEGNAPGALAAAPPGIPGVSAMAQSAAPKGQSPPGPAVR